MGNSSIEWTEKTWNPVRGCTKISPGCKHCYAETFAERFRGVKGHPYEQGFDFRLAPDKLLEPTRWKKPKMVFVNSMSDLFHDKTPESYLDQVMNVMANCQRHTFQVLTKRSHRMREYMIDWVRRTQSKPPANVWFGASVESQKYAEERIPELLGTPAAVRFLSCEPLLGAVNLSHWLSIPDGLDDDPLAAMALHDAIREGRGDSVRKIAWVIIGGESGHGARSMRLDWARTVVAQCRDAGVKVFVKQLGAWPVIDEKQWRDDAAAGRGVAILNARGASRAPPGTVVLRIGGKKGGDMESWPEDLRVREFPP